MDHKHSVITIDYRERPSGIPQMLRNEFSYMTFGNLNAGDYQIHNTIIIERKTAQDFIRSLTHQELFNQCKKLKQSGFPVLMIIEGNPLKTSSEIKTKAVKGTLLAITGCWQIPVFYTSSKQETAKTILRLSQNEIVSKRAPIARKAKPKHLVNKQLFFLQGLPGISKILSYDLLKEFKTIEKLLVADIKSLQKIRGIGKTKAQNIYNFLHKEFNP